MGQLTRSAHKHSYLGCVPQGGTLLSLVSPGVVQGQLPPLNSEGIKYESRSWDPAFVGKHLGAGLVHMDDRAYVNHT